MNDKQESVKGEHAPISRIPFEKSRGLSVSAEIAPPGVKSAPGTAGFPKKFYGGICHFPIFYDKIEIIEQKPPGRLLCSAPIRIRNGGKIIRYRYISDCHVHSDCSRDGRDPAIMMCESAARLGLCAVAITDHCECNTYYQEEYDRSIRRSFFEAKKAAAVFRGRLRVYAGVELGQPTQNLDAARDVLSACQFDFVLGSLHNLKEMDDFYFLDPERFDTAQLLGRYFDELTQMALWNGFDSLAHLTYPLRYLAVRQSPDDCLCGVQDKVDTVLELLVRNHKALEINTSGLRQKIGDTLPPLSVLKRFRQLGGRYVTIGSDAHRWADVGAGIETGLSLLQAAGFSKFTIFIGREPHLIPIQ